MTQPPIDVRDMAIVHRTFRAAYAEAARLVRDEPVPTAARVTFLADHIDFTVETLHIHHEGEDELLYPKLIERLPDQASMTEEVEHEHELVKTALDSVSAACSTWRNHPSSDAAAELASALDQLNAVAERHLDDEEQKIVPLAAVTLTQQEWDAIGEHAVAQIPRDKQPIAFGLILDPLDDTDRAHMKRVLPPPVRLLYPILIGRKWNRYALELRGQ
jgi:hemerythrin-like domain-containing protein